MQEILNRALKQEFPVKAIEKLSTDERVNFTSLSKNLHEVKFNTRYRCVYNSSSYKLGVYRDDILINTYSFTGKDPFSLVCKKINELKNSINE